MPKCEREGYDESPFFMMDESSGTPNAVAWVDLEKAVPELLRHWPDQLQLHVEYLEDDFETVAEEQFGDIARDKLQKVLTKHGATLLGDGGVRFRIWRRESDKERCIGVDEHGVLYLWESPRNMRGWLKRLGAQERDAELIYEGEHWHHVPEDADEGRAKLAKGLGL